MQAGLSTSPHIISTLVEPLLCYICLLSILLTLYAEHVHSSQPVFLSTSLSTMLVSEILAMRLYSGYQGSEQIRHMPICALFWKLLLLVLDQVSKREFAQRRPHNDLDPNRSFIKLLNQSLVRWVKSGYAVGYAAIRNEEDMQNFQDLPSEFETTQASRDFLRTWEGGEFSPFSFTIFKFFSPSVLIEKLANKASKHGLVYACLQTLGSGAYLDVGPRICLLALCYSQPFLIRQIVIAATESDLSTSSAGILVAAFALLQLAIIVSLLRVKTPIVLKKKLTIDRQRKAFVNTWSTRE